MGSKFYSFVSSDRNSSVCSGLLMTCSKEANIYQLVTWVDSVFKRQSRTRQYYTNRK